MNEQRKEMAFQTIDEALDIARFANDQRLGDPSVDAAAKRLILRAGAYINATSSKIIADRNTFARWSKHNRDKASSQNEKWHLRAIRRERMMVWGLDRLIGKSLTVTIPGLQMVGRCKRVGPERISIEEARRRPFAGSRLDELCPPPSLSDLVGRGFLEHPLVVEPKGGAIFQGMLVSDMPKGGAHVFAMDPAISPRASYTPEPVPLLRDAFMRIALDGLDDRSRRAAINMSPPASASEEPVAYLITHEDGAKMLAFHSSGLEQFVEKAGWKPLGYVAPLQEQVKDLQAQVSGLRQLADTGVKWRKRAMSSALDAKEHLDRENEIRQELDELKSGYDALEKTVQNASKAVGDDTGNMWTKITTTFMVELPRLRKALADRGALLREVYEAVQRDEPIGAGLFSSIKDNLHPSESGKGDHK